MTEAMGADSGEMGMDAKFFDLDSQMESLRSKLATFPATLTKNYQDRLDVS